MDTMKILTFDDLNGAPDLEEKHIEIQGLNGAVVIKGFTKEEMDQINEEATSNDVQDRAKFVELVVRRGLRQPELTEAQYKALTKKGAGILTAIANAVLKESGLTKEVTREVKKSFCPQA